MTDQAPVAVETARPVLLAVDDEPSVARAVERDLRRRYGRDYRVLRAESGEGALTAVRESKLRGAKIALLLADQRMPEMSGVEFLEEAMRIAPEAKRVLLTAYADTQAAIDAINRVSLDHYLLKPWDPPDEQLYPVVDDLLDAWRADAPDDADRIQVVGHRWSRESHDARDFLARNQVPYRCLDVEPDDDGRRPTARPPCRSCSSPTAACCTARASRSWPSAPACAGGRSSSSTTSSSSAAARPASPRRSTAPRRACAPRSSSARRRAGRRDRAPGSKTTSASRSASPGPTWPGGRPRRPSASAPSS